MSRVLILWNSTEEDVVELWRQDGLAVPWETVDEEMALLATVLRDGGHEPFIVNIRDDLGVLLDTLAKVKPDAIMNLVEFFRDDIEHEHHVPALFELLDLEYTGNRPLALSLCQKKPHAKALLVAAGIPTPNSVLIDVGGVVPAHLALRFPLIVKPAYEDASGGIDAGSVVPDRAALETRVAHVLAEHKMAALVEEYIEGREVHCAILGNDPPEVLPLFEMEFSDPSLPRIITYRAKWDPFSPDFAAVEGRCPPTDLDPAVCAHVQDVAVRAFHALGCRDYARVDMRLDPVTGDPYVLEVNPNPDLADGCAFATSVRASGRTYSDAINQIVGFALARAKNRPAPSHGPSDDLLREYLATKTTKTTKTSL